MTRFFIEQIRSDLRSYPACEIVDDALCALLAVLFVGAVCGLLVGIWAA